MISRAYIHVARPVRRRQDGAHRDTLADELLLDPRRARRRSDRLRRARGVAAPRRRAATVSTSRRYRRYAVHVSTEPGEPGLLLNLGSAGTWATSPLVTCPVSESATPYIATRYAKTRGRDRRDLTSPSDRAAFLLQDLRGQIGQILGIDPNGVRVEMLADEHGTFKIGNRWRPIQFKRYRRKRSDDGGRRLAGAFRLRFSEAVTGPIALGHSSHFGMGLFSPAANVAAMRSPS